LPGDSFWCQTSAAEGTTYFNPNNGVVLASSYFTTSVVFLFLTVYLSFYRIIFLWLRVLRLRGRLPKNLLNQTLKPPRPLKCGTWMKSKILRRGPTRIAHPLPRNLKAKMEEEKENAKEIWFLWVHPSPKCTPWSSHFFGTSSVFFFVYHGWLRFVSFAYCLLEFCCFSFCTWILLLDLNFLV
jgi:hypothetical protein